ncbi:MAG: heavy metal translocating P-type ATPase, partial [Lachnospiraceae bacterium]|nr:heavy metal translocating P-type ATPase [Lachnospiraceae bacterium]
MRFIVRAESRGRIRVHADIDRMSLAEADILEYYMKAVPGVTNVKVYDRTCDAVINYGCSREDVTEALALFAFGDERAQALVPEHTSRASDREFEERLVNRIIARYGRRFLLPHTLRVAWCVYKAAGYFADGIKALARGELSVAVLDASAITVSLARGDHDTSSSIMFLLGIGDLLEEWARKKSIEDLAGLMSLNVDKAWVVRDGAESLVSVSDIQAGEQVVVRMGNMIPLDGKVISGTAMVNQQTMTGESMPVKKAAGSYVYGGTVMEEGECVYTVDKEAGSGRYDRIVNMIEESERLKSETESKAASLADRLVPYSLAGTLAAYALTRDVQTAMAFLMVDYSCALKLSMPLAVLSAMRESGRHRITVKGGKFLEIVSQADTIVFDKTGTLTNATPTVADVIAFGGNDRDEMLRIAACLE